MKTRHSCGLPASAPGYWMYEISGRLVPAVEAYLTTDGPMSIEHIGLLRAYIRQWMQAPWKGGPELIRLKNAVDHIHTRQDLTQWFSDALHCGIDPL